MERLPEEVLERLVGWCSLEARVGLWKHCEAVRAMVRERGAGRVSVRGVGGLRALVNRDKATDSVLGHVRSLHARHLSLTGSALKRIAKRMPELHELYVCQSKNIIPGDIVRASLPRLKRLSIACSSQKTRGSHLFYYTEEEQNSFPPLEFLQTSGTFDALYQSANLLKHSVALREIKFTLTHPLFFQSRPEPEAIMLDGVKAFSLHSIGCFVPDISPMSYTKLIKPFLHLPNWEMIAIENVSSHPNVIVSGKFFQEAEKTGFDVGVLESNVEFASLAKHVNLYMWDRVLDNYNTEFYKCVFNKIISKIPQNLCIKKRQSLKPRLDGNNSYIVNPCTLISSDSGELFDIGGVIRKDSKINVTIMKTCKCHISPNNTTARHLLLARRLDDLFTTSVFDKVEYLSLCGVSAVDLGKSFFKNLFTNSIYLTTLNFEDNYYQDLAENIVHSNSLRNLRIKCAGIDLEKLFTGLGKCKLLENFVIWDIDNWNYAKISGSCPYRILNFIKNNENLYNLQIAMKYLDAEDKSRLPSFLKRGLNGNDRGLNFELRSELGPLWHYDPQTNFFTHYHDISETDINRNLRLNPPCGAVEKNYI